MRTSDAKSPDASDAGKTTKIGVLAPMGIIVFIALTLAGTFLLLTAPGCSRSVHQPDSLTCLNFPSSSLPKRVSLAPWDGSDKMPWMTSNPFLSNDERVLSEVLKGSSFERGSVAEVYMAAYWVRGPDESIVEISLMALRFKEPAVALRAAKAMQPEMDELAKVEPHSAPSLIHHGSIVCILGHTSAVEEDAWLGMLRLVENAVAKMQ